MSTTNEEIRKFLEQSIAENEVMLFMKGTPDQPRCGFSMRTSAALNTLGVRYAAMDILPDPRIREELSAISDWPTIPQLFVSGKLVGGADIVAEMYETGELAELLGVEQPEDVEPEPPSVQPPIQSAPVGLENRLSD
ncbi:MAG TPA: Grx4 family monothiol glutaredoxin [Thermoleophilaceae bacterium]